MGDYLASVYVNRWSLATTHVELATLLMVTHTHTLSVELATLLMVPLPTGMCCGLCSKKKTKKVDDSAKYMVRAHMITL